MTDLHAFLTRHDHGGSDNLLRALRDLCQNGGGTWMQPDILQCAHHATHLVEISAFGINAYGPTAREAAINWRKHAYRQLAVAA